MLIKAAQIVVRAVFNLEGVFKIAKKVISCLGYFCKKICCRELWKIAQSGHTDCTTGSPFPTKGMNDSFLSFEPVLNRQLQIGLDSGWRIVEEVAMALFVGVGFVLRCIIFAYLKQREIKRLQQRRDHLAHLRVKAEEQVNPLYNVSVFLF